MGYAVYADNAEVERVCKLAQADGFIREFPNQYETMIVEGGNNVSGGQKQRVAIAGIIAMRPRCIVMDEPTAMLDPKGRKEIMATIKTLNKEHGITVVLITHYMEEAAKADRVIVIDKGNILLDDVPKRIFSQVELLKSVGLDVPQATELMYELKKCGLDVPDDIIDEDECAQVLYDILKNKE